MTDREKFQEIVRKHFMAAVENGVGELEFIYRPAEKGCREAIACTTWGYDYEERRLPQTWEELIHDKVMAQMDYRSVGKALLPVYFKIMRETDEAFSN